MIYFHDLIGRTGDIFNGYFFSFIYNFIVSWETLLGNIVSRIRRPRRQVNTLIEHAASIISVNVFRLPRAELSTNENYSTCKMQRLYAGR